MNSRDYQAQPIAVLAAALHLSASLNEFNWAIKETGGGSSEQRFAELRDRWEGRDLAGAVRALNGAAEIIDLLAKGEA